ncbi:hypothetical protein TeGR_g12758 [Tetraparma gracilis]|uniref:Uncharacterized protein n=1 Tax=Tetraparma gracilis TaxID=2962635 RepID=A0ABQ6MEN6_9STRA|nr:hypothetical protein TeGR_g12758 [Tetraparma gracilis]
MARRGGGVRTQVSPTYSWAALHTTEGVRYAWTGKRCFVEGPHDLVFCAVCACLTWAAEKGAPCARCEEPCVVLAKEADKVAQPR